MCDKEVCMGDMTPPTPDKIACDTTPARRGDELLDFDVWSELTRTVAGSITAAMPEEDE